YHDKYSKGLILGLSNQNFLRKNISNKIDIKTENLFINVIKQEELKKFKIRLKEYLENRTIKIRPEKFGDTIIPNWIDQLLYQLKYKQKFKEKELKGFLLEINQNGISRIPTLGIRFSIKS